MPAARGRALVLGDRPGIDQLRLADEFAQVGQDARVVDEIVEGVADARQAVESGLVRDLGFAGGAAGRAGRQGLHPHLQTQGQEGIGEARHRGMNGLI